MDPPFLLVLHQVRACYNTQATVYHRKLVGFQAQDGHILVFTGFLGLQVGSQFKFSPLFSLYGPLQHLLLKLFNSFPGAGIAFQCASVLRKLLGKVWAEYNIGWI